MAKVLQRLDILLFANTAQYRSEMRDTQQSTTTMFGAIKADAANMAKVGAAAFAGMALAGTAAIGVMIKEQIELGNEITKLARISNTGVESMQKLAIAAKAVGVEQDTLGDIYKDTQDKIGDFLSTGGGGMADYFENIAPLVGQTAEQFRELSGPNALQLYYDGLQAANLSQSELVFYLEAIASDASALIPLLHDAGAGFDVWAEAAENAGAVMTEETIAATRDLQAANDLMMLSYDGAKKQFSQAFIPVLADLANQLVGSGDAADVARDAGEYLVKTFKVLAVTGIGVVTVFKTIGTALGAMGAMLAQYANMTDGVDFTSPFAFFQLAKNAVFDVPTAQIDILKMAVADVGNILDTADRQATAVEGLGTGARANNRFVVAAAAQRELGQQIGLTGQQHQAAAAAAEKAAKATDKATKAAKDLNAAYVSNTQLSGLKLKSNEAIAGGQARGYTAEFAEVTQSLLGDKLRYFSAINDTYHKGKDSKHASGQAFDVVLKDAKQAAQAAAIIEQAAKKYGFNVKILNEYAKPSKNSTGGHLHVSVTGQAGVGADMQYIKQQNNAAAQEQQRAAADQARLLEQQAKDRIAIRMDYANEATRIEMQLADKIAKIEASGFSANETQAFIVDAQKRAAIELSSFEDTQAKKLDALGSFAKSERDIITQNTIYRAKEVINDLSLTDEQRDQALALIKQKAVYELNQLDLVHAQEMQYAQQSEQTDIERITNQYALERREIVLTINMDKQLRKAKIDALNQAEQYALTERRYAYESELRQLNSFGQSELAALRADYADQRRILDNRTDIDPSQISELRNASKGRELKETRDLQKNALDGFNAQNYEMSGIGANYGLAQQYQQRLKVIEDAEKAELDLTIDFEQAKYAARMAFESAAYQLTMNSSEAMLGNLAGSFKTLLGEQNAGYQLLFAGQQAFVMASAGLNMYEAWGDAMAEGATLTQKFASAAVIAAEFGRIIGAASSMTLELPGYQIGGFTASGGDSDAVGLVHANEFVANAPTTKRYRPELEAMHNGTYERNASSTPNVNVNVTVNSNGSSSVDADEKMGRNFGNVISAAVKQQIMKEQRQGGMLYGR